MVLQAGELCNMLGDYICDYSYSSMQLVQTHTMCKCKIRVLKRNSEGWELNSKVFGLRLN